MRLRSALRLRSTYSPLSLHFFAPIVFSHCYFKPPLFAGFSYLHKACLYSVDCHDNFGLKISLKAVRKT